MCDAHLEPAVRRRAGRTVARNSEGADGTVPRLPDAKFKARHFRRMPAAGHAREHLFMG